MWRRPLSPHRIAALYWLMISHQVPCSATFDIAVDFRDPLTNATSTRDFTLDPRATLAVSPGA